MNNDHLVAIKTALFGNRKDQVMAELSNTEHELVAVGAAIASNGVPCAEFHMTEAKRVGLTDPQIVEAVRVADKVRQVPTRKVLRN
jgi:AhpD family alkylhydroperoxidase